jgi:hypothetical protein
MLTPFFGMPEPDHEKKGKIVTQFSNSVSILFVVLGIILQGVA